LRNLVKCNYRENRFYRFGKLQKEGEEFGIKKRKEDVAPGACLEAKWY